MPPQTQIISGLFLSLSIVSTVLGCALWNFPIHSQHENLLYMGGMLSAFVLNSSIVCCLVKAEKDRNSQLFSPYIVCASLHFVISVLAVCLFTGETIRAILQGTSLEHLYGVLVFFLLSVFWLWSIRIVKGQRDYIKKVSGEHMIFTNPEIV